MISKVDNSKDELQYPRESLCGEILMISAVTVILSPPKRNFIRHFLPLSYSLVATVTVAGIWKTFARLLETLGVFCSNLVATVTREVFGALF